MTTKAGTTCNQSPPSIDTLRSNHGTLCSRNANASTTRVIVTFPPSSSCAPLDNKGVNNNDARPVLHAWHQVLLGKPPLRQKRICPPCGSPSTAATAATSIESTSLFGRSLHAPPGVHLAVHLLLVLVVFEQFENAVAFSVALAFDTDRGADVEDTEMLKRCL